MTELTRYLSNMMSIVLLGLPTEIKYLIYFEALSHAAAGILVSCVLEFQLKDLLTFSDTSSGPVHYLDFARRCQTSQDRHSSTLELCRFTVTTKH